MSGQDEKCPIVESRPPDKAISNVVTLDITRSLRDRGKDKGADRAAISYEKVDITAPRTGMSRWIHIKNQTLDPDLVSAEILKLDMSDFRVSLCLGHLRWVVDKTEFPAAATNTAWFACRGHHHDPVFDYTGMPGAHPIVVTFPYFSHPVKGGATKNAPSGTHLPPSIAELIFGAGDQKERYSKPYTTLESPGRNHFDVVVPTFFAFIVDPHTIITQSPHDIDDLIGQSLTVAPFDKVVPPEPFHSNAHGRQEGNNPVSTFVEIEITDGTDGANKQYMLPSLQRRNWKTFLAILDLVFRDVPRRDTGPISRYLRAGRYILVDDENEIVTDRQWKSYYRHAQITGKLHLRLVRKDNWNISVHRSANSEVKEEEKGSTLKERKEQYLRMLKERKEHETAERAKRSAASAAKAAQKATVETDSESDSDNDNNSDEMSARDEPGRVYRMPREKGPAARGPRYEFLVSQDPDVPSQILADEKLDVSTIMNVQPALLWQGPASSATSSKDRAKAAARARAAAMETALSPRKLPDESETKLNEPFMQSLDKSFILGMPEYQRTACCTLADFEEVLAEWQRRKKESEIHQVDIEESRGFRRLHDALLLYKLYIFFVPVEDDSPLSQKFRSALVNLVKNELQIPGELLRHLTDTLNHASSNMESLRAHLQKLYPWGKPNFYIPQSLLDAFALVLAMTFSLGQSIWPQECGVELDTALPVNISPFDRDSTNFSDPGPLLKPSQDICGSIRHGFRMAKMELLVSLMFRPELPLLTRTTTYEVADAEAILMLVMENISLGLDGSIPSLLVDDCRRSLTHLRYKSRKAPSRLLLREIEMEIDKIGIFVRKTKSASWVAERFADEQQLKDAVEEGRDDDSESDIPVYHKAHDRPAFYDPQEYPHVVRPRYAYRIVPRPPPPPIHHTGANDNRYYSHRYYRKDDEYRSMKFGEEIGTRCRQKLDSRATELQKLTSELRQLSSQVDSLVDIKAEDHGQAILTFTIITIIFLPLSFVSSFFGMNTSDIRGMNDSQKIFWYTAVPFTGLTVVLTWLLTFQAKKIRDHASSWRIHATLFLERVYRKKD